MQSLAGVVFDMDGVIFDTERLVQDCWQVVADRHQIPNIRETCVACLGLNQTASKAEFLRRYGAAFPYDTYKAEMRALFFGDFYGDHLPLKQGALELLQALREQKIRTALATSTRSGVVFSELQDAGISDYFAAVVCGDMVTHSKPHPEIFLRACQALGVAPAETIAIEDSFYGVQAAHAAGMRTLMVPDQKQPTPEIAALTECVLPSLHQVQRYLLP